MPELTLDDLVRESGFSKRQIRFYITRRLIEGAGASRGPNAVYGEETLRRLQLIRQLKEQRIQPTGRAMTLDEIAHALDTLSPDGMDALLSGRAELAVLDTEAGMVEGLGAPPSSRAPEPPALGDAGVVRELDGMAEQQPRTARRLRPRREPPPFDRDSLTDLVYGPTSDPTHVTTMLLRLYDAMHDAAHGPLAERRITRTLDHRTTAEFMGIDFQVQHPTSEHERNRLQMMTEALGQLLAWKERRR
jgi:DNA-binding transcriptional MerR regulator